MSSAGDIYKWVRLILKGQVCYSVSDVLMFMTVCVPANDRVCVCVCILCLCWTLIHSALYQIPSISVWQAADVERGQIAAPINAFDLHTLTVTNTLADASVTTDVFLTWKKCDSNSHCLCLKGPSVTINDRRIQSKSPSNSPKAMVGNDKWQRN